MTENLDFDMQAAWLRRFSADAESNLRAFALRLKEAMPDSVVIHESRGLFGGGGKITGVEIELGENRYGLEVEHGRLKATIAMVVRGVRLNTKSLAPADWFLRLSEDTRKFSEHAQAFSQSLTGFMTN